jgi:hypothetical protein
MPDREVIAALIITWSGRKQLGESVQGWEQTKAILDLFLTPGKES